ncbi:Transmembrane protein 62 [Haplosporangium sp. Z 767]|nr:Transmembrane protein 62 [Haplosporangium sp. Z 11]KAF9193367.1 Transmembrane protein 62 [Haplosporangium sp. Z 767]
MSRRLVSGSTDPHNNGQGGPGAIRKRSWLRTAFAFTPFLTLVISAWLYALHLDRIANQSMVQSRNNIGNNLKKQTTSAEATAASFAAPADQDSMVIGDSKDNIFYFVQVSDLHISAFRKASTANFYTFLSTAIPLVEPAFVVVTGDLTDAKDKQLVGSMQYLSEWVTYRDALEESGVLDKRNGTFWHDLRGNHDCFNVPSWDSKENMFADMSATKAPGFMFDVRTDYGKYGFIGIDACPKPGPARPYNFFGLFETPDMDNLARRLELSKGNNHTFVFSHYPVTTTMFGESSLGESFADLSKSFSVYMCGHLHKLKWGLGDALQAYQPTHFLELEVGDMKQNGLYRIMVVDHDMISFTDVSMPMTTIPPALLPNFKHPEQDTDDDIESENHSMQPNNNMEKKRRPTLGPRLPTNPIIVVSNPKDSRYLIPKHEPVNRIGTSTHIRFLAWTDNMIPEGEERLEHVRESVKIEIRIDGKLHDQPTRFAGTRAEEQTEEEEFLPLYVSAWNTQDYNDGQDHELEIKVTDRQGRLGVSRSVFRVDGQRSDMKGGFAEWIMWANVALLLKALFTTGYLFVALVLLILPKLYSLYLQTSPPPPSPVQQNYSKIASDMSTDTPSQPLEARGQFKNGYDAWLDRKSRHLYRLSSTLSSASSRHRFWNRFVNHTIHAHVLRFVHFSTQPVLFYTTLAFTLMLVTMPHFWGNFVPTAGDQGQGYFYLQGIYLPNAGGHLGGGLGAASLDPLGPERGVHRRPLSVLSGAISSLIGGNPESSPSSSDSFYGNAGGTWIPMADTWMSTIWTVIYDLVIFLYYLTLCATPSGYLYSPSNPHRLRPYHRTWYIRCLIFGIWVFRCCSVLMTAELYGPSVIWTGIGTWWLVVVGWMMFMVGWSRSRIERDILLRREDDGDGEVVDPEEEGDECEVEVKEDWERCINGYTSGEGQVLEKVSLIARKDAQQQQYIQVEDESHEGEGSEGFKKSPRRQARQNRE